MSTRIHRLDAGRAGISAPRSTSVAPGPERTNSLVAALRHLRDRVARARRRRAAIAELSELSDRDLQDIGVRRNQIPKLVDGMLRHRFDSQE